MVEDGQALKIRPCQWWTQHPAQKTTWIRAGDIKTQGSCVNAAGDTSIKNAILVDLDFLPMKAEEDLWAEPYG
ncbi:hypothetical protein DPMN_108684 [Dreissena polymorpha]|uniref:Uncharacterized protein n=1 Tax=Dreissena polymorpha TaxID=45954 RepID=A0A9D4QL95_DREPO|nr:hypothetical protein DPMN_108684 [Dreissena polymorpha]